MSRVRIVTYLRMKRSTSTVSRRNQIISLSFLIFYSPHNLPPFSLTSNPFLLYISEKNITINNNKVTGVRIVTFMEYQLCFKNFVLQFYI